MGMQVPLTCDLVAPVLSLRDYEGSWQRWSYDLLTLLHLLFILINNMYQNVPINAIAG